jgi:histidyl-tRNA synthetase
MPNTKPPSGMRDFLPESVHWRRTLLATVQRIFESYGYQPLETPAMERLEVLIGKYAEEGARLIYRVTKRGDNAAAGEADLGLRYNFTVPLARVVAEHQGKIGNIFKAYQIGPVWRADRPGQGRQRESHHCDVDIVGAHSPMAEVEILLVLSEALRALGLVDLTITLNSRKVLAGLIEAYGLPPEMETSDFNGVVRWVRAGAEVAGNGAAGPSERAAEFKPLVEDLRRPDNLASVRTRLEACRMGVEGLAEIDSIEELAAPFFESGRIVFDPLLARGLDYYTGALFEIRVPGSPAAVALGGRYDDLIGLFAGRAVPACGASLYMDRIALLMEERAPKVAPSAAVLVTVWDQSSRVPALSLAAELREWGISAEVFLEEGGLGRQLRYASQKGISFALLLGPDEISRGEVGIKDLRSGDQITVPREQVAATLAGELHGDKQRQ